MTRSIRVRGINSLLRKNVLGHHEDRTIAIDKFPGAHANKIKHCFKFSAKELKPDTLVVVAGANDISYDFRNGTANARNIANRIIDIGKEAANANVKNIYVLGIIQRRDFRVKTLITQTNLELRSLCDQAGFIFIDTSEIYVDDLDRDGLHLNPTGTRKLMHIILKCNTFYNPYLN